MSIGAKDGEAQQYLLSLMDKLEQVRRLQRLTRQSGEADFGGGTAQLKNEHEATNEAITDDNVASAYVENFALKVFIQADNEDRNGKATRSVLVAVA